MIQKRNPFAAAPGNETTNSDEPTITLASDAKTQPGTTALLPTQIRADAASQQRVAMNTTVVEEYAEAMQTGANFPPLHVFHDGETYWLADGFHRLNAHRKTFGEDKRIFVQILPGSRREALRFALSANEMHGLRRTGDDKRKAVQTALADDEWSQWSDREIARLCKVSHTFIAKQRAILTGNVASENEKAVLSGNVARYDTVPTETPLSGNVARYDTVPTETPLSGNVARYDAAPGEANPSVNVDRQPAPASPTVRKFERNGKTHEMTVAAPIRYASIPDIHLHLRVWVSKLANDEHRYTALCHAKEGAAERGALVEYLQSVKCNYRVPDLKQAISNYMDGLRTSLVAQNLRSAGYGIEYDTYNRSWRAFHKDVRGGAHYLPAVPDAAAAINAINERIAQMEALKAPPTADQQAPPEDLERWLLQHGWSSNTNREHGQVSKPIRDTGLISYFTWKVAGEREKAFHSAWKQEVAWQNSQQKPTAPAIIQNQVIIDFSDAIAWLETSLEIFHDEPEIRRSNIVKVVRLLEGITQGDVDELIKEIKGAK